MPRAREKRSEMNVQSVRLMILAHMSCGLWLAPLTAAAAPEKPNIVLIVSDDLSYGDLGCFGQQKIHTPNLDRLAASGVLCQNAYAGGSWCAPSRTSLLTGLRSDRWSRPPRKA
jgi:hypothetical protein